MKPSCDGHEEYQLALFSTLLVFNDISVCSKSIGKLHDVDV